MIARDELVAERVNLHLERLGLDIAVEANVLLINHSVINAIELNVEISAWSVGKVDAEVVDALIHLQPSLFLHFVAR